MTFYPKSTAPQHVTLSYKKFRQKSMFPHDVLWFCSLSKLLQVSHRVVNSPDEIGVPRGGHGGRGHRRRRRLRGPANLEVSDGAVAPPGDELVDVEDESDDDLDEHCQVQVPVYPLLLGPERPVA